MEPPATLQDLLKSCEQIVKKLRNPPTRSMEKPKDALALLDTQQPEFVRPTSSGASSKALDILASRRAKPK